MDVTPEVKHWKLRNKIERTQSEMSSLIQSLERETGLSPITLRICISRGLDSSQAIQSYLQPRFENLRSPFTLRGMDEAVERLVKARAHGTRIRVFGDYDVDGTTGAALLSWVFRDFGFLCDVRHPDRF